MSSMTDHADWAGYDEFATIFLSNHTCYVLLFNLLLLAWLTDAGCRSKEPCPAPATAYDSGGFGTLKASDAANDIVDRNDELFNNDMLFGNLGGGGGG